MCMGSLMSNLNVTPFSGKAVSLVQLLAPLKDIMADDSITEICINRPGEVWTEHRDGWERTEMENLSQDRLQSIITAIASFNGNDVNENLPLMSAALPNKERVQIVMPPACEAGTTSITIRKPSDNHFTMDDYVKNDFFKFVGSVEGGTKERDAHLKNLLREQEYEEFFRVAVKLEKVIVVAGETGSGKTTFMKALADLIDEKKRIITIEDTPEMTLPNHPNHVNLFYRSEAKQDATVTATTLLKSVMRMKPDRIILAEVRGGETFDFINAAVSGHGGSITSCHAGSCELAFNRLEMMMLQNAQARAMPYEVIRKLLRDVIDVVVHVHNDHEGGMGRHISEIWFEPTSLKAS